MILISCRHDFVSDIAFAKENQVRNYQNMKDITKFMDLDMGNLLLQATGKHVLVLVHGFRNPIRNVTAAYEALLNKLIESGLREKPHYDLVLGFLWPGFQTPLGFFPAVPFANRSASFLRALLQQLSTTALTVDVQTHSLGARVALQSLSATEGVFVDNLMLTAPAVENECLEPKREFHQALDNCRRCFVYHSASDPALKVFTLASLDLALGLKGPQHPSVIKKECPNVFVVDCSDVVINDHGGYRKSGVYLSHWARLMSDEALPRFEKLKG